MPITFIFALCCPSSWNPERFFVLTLSEPHIKLYSRLAAHTAGIGRVCLRPKGEPLSLTATPPIVETLLRF